MKTITSSKRLFLSLLAFVIVLILVLCLQSTVFSDSSNTIQKDPQQIIAEIYAKRFNVTLDEASYRLALQDAFPDLGAILETNEASTYGGLWIQHEPEYQIIVAFTSSGDKILSQYTKYIPEVVAPFIETTKVDKSLKELLEDQSLLYESVLQQGLRIHSRVDVINNCVSIDILKDDIELFRQAEKANTLVIPEKLNVNTVDSLMEPQTDIYGGLPLSLTSGGGAIGASGFAVEDLYSDDEGIATAGHAADTLYYGGTQLTYEGGYYVYAWDVQWHTTPGLNVENKIRYWSDGSTLSITAIKPRSQQKVGDIVSKYGNTTHYTAGMIISTTALGCPPSSSSTWIEVDNVFDYDLLSDEGDSGGPWFSGNTALGIHHAGNGEQATYMAIDYISILGVAVKTSP